MPFHNRLFLIPAAYRDAANAYARSIDPDPNCGDTFVVPASANGQFPASHWVAGVQLGDAKLAEVEAMVAANFPLAVVADGDAISQHQLLAANGLRVADDL